MTRVFLKSKLSIIAALGAAMALGSVEAVRAQHYHGGHYHGGHDHGGGYYPSSPYRSHGHDYHSGGRVHYYGGEAHPHDHATHYTYGGFSHVDDLALQLERKANALCNELYHNYQHNPGFKQTYREAYEILTRAKYIHGLEHSRNRGEIRKAAAELDALYHHVHRGVVDWTPHYHRRLGYGGLSAKLAAVEGILHHLMTDVGVTSQFTAGDLAGGETSPPPGN